MDDGPGCYDHLTFNAPLSEGRADALATRVAAADPADVLDVGCGWGELLLGVLERAPAARGLGVDTDERLLARGRAAARERGLAERVSLEHRPGEDLADPADLVLCVGSSHAVGEQLGTALAALRRLVRPGGRLVLGEGFWEQHGPVEETLLWDDLLEMPDLAGLVDAGIAAGFRPLFVEWAGAEEWSRFESGYLADLEEWLLTHQDHAEAERVRAEADAHRDRWLRGYRHGLGFAYLTLGVPR